MGTGFFSGIKQPERIADHSPPSNTEVKNAFIAWTETNFIGSSLTHVLAIIYNLDRAWYSTQATVTELGHAAVLCILFLRNVFNLGTW